jgi:hypothetical protein
MDIGRFAGDRLRDLNNLSEWSKDQILDNVPSINSDNHSIPDVGKPDDWAMRGKKANYPINSKMGRAAIGNNAANIIAGAGSKLIGDALDPILSPIYQSAVQSVANGLDMAFSAPPAPNLPPPQVPEPGPTIKLPTSVIGTLGVGR